jgi:cystathionine beta-synthase
VKDRIIRHIFKNAEETGKLRPGGTVVAASSGNTGAATAMVAAMRGYRAVITTSSKCSSEKIDSIRAYGAMVIVCPDGVSESHPDHYMNVATRLAAENDDWFDVNQYDNAQNPDAHYCSLGPEIWEQTRGEVTHFIVAGSTGGTISGNAKYLKEKNPNCKVILADPVGSIFTSYFRGNGEKGGKYLVEGVGKGSIPGAMDFALIDDVMPVSDSNAFAMCHYLASQAGILAGGSSGLNALAAICLANKMTEPATIVTIMPDTGIKYLSKIYNPTWLAENGIVTGIPNFENAAGRPYAPDAEKDHPSEEYAASQVFQNNMFGAGSPI